MLLLGETKWRVLNESGSVVAAGVFPNRIRQVELDDSPGFAMWYTEHPAGDLEPGHYTLSVDTVGFTIPRGTTVRVGMPEPTNGPKVTASLEGKFEVLPFGRPSVEVVPNDALLNAFKANVSILREGSIRQPGPVGDSMVSPGWIRIGLELMWKNWDTSRNFGGIEMVWSAELLDPDTRSVVPGTSCKYSPTLSFSAGLRGGTFEFEAKQAVQPGRYLLRLRADPDKAERSVYITKILGGELEFDVELK